MDLKEKSLIGNFFLIYAGHELENIIESLHYLIVRVSKNFIISNVTIFMSFYQDQTQMDASSTSQRLLRLRG